MFKKKTQAKVIEPEAPAPPAPPAQPKTKSTFLNSGKPKAQIVEAGLLENGLIRTTVISNKSLGEVGEEFELD